AARVGPGERVEEAELREGVAKAQGVERIGEPVDRRPQREHGVPVDPEAPAPRLRESGGRRPADGHAERPRAGGREHRGRVAAGPGRGGLSMLARAARAAPGAASEDDGGGEREAGWTWPA